MTITTGYTNNLTVPPRGNGLSRLVVGDQQDAPGAFEAKRREESRVLGSILIGRHRGPRRIWLMMYRP